MVKPIRDIRKPEIVAAAIKAMGAANIGLLANHGVLILARDIGEAFIAPDVADSGVLDFLREELGCP